MLFRSLYKRALAIYEKSLGPEHPDVAWSLNELALLYDKQGKYAAAEPLYKRALAIYEKSLGPEHPDVAWTLNNLGKIYQAQGKYATAEPLYKRALAIYGKALGPDHPDVAWSLNNLAGLYHTQGRYSEALASVRRGTAILRARFTRSGLEQSAGLQSEQGQWRFSFYAHVDIALNAEQQGDREVLAAEAFAVMQLARFSDAAQSLERMAARSAAGNDALSRVIREREDAVSRFNVLDKRLIEALSTPPESRNAKNESRLRSELGSLGATLDKLTEEIEERFPEYAELTRREPLALAATQRLLLPGEALLTFVRSRVGDKTHVFVVRHERTDAYTVELGVEELEDIVSELRAGLDLTGMETAADLPLFDSVLAFDLYRRLLAPAEPFLQGVDHLFVVPEGALESLPLAVLVTEPVGELPEMGAAGLSSYRNVAWLAKRYALTTLPSVASVRALRQLVRPAVAERPFIGFGDPVLRGGPERGAGIQVASLFRGSIADVEEVRGLPSLPETADELREMATFLGAGESSVYLREQATETNVKALPLKSSRVIAFATHGLLSGELTGLAEPALVLTPPAEGTEHDDGLLTASEIAQLDLNAEWVILSACNTAGGDRPGAQGLSGLAKAFFYAGARALLVSHWPVESVAATALTTRMFAERANDPSIGRAEALRRSMLALAADDTRPHYAHPAFWAPFVVIGEGGA